MNAINNINPEAIIKQFMRPAVQHRPLNEKELKYFHMRIRTCPLIMDSALNEVRKFLVHETDKEKFVETFLNKISNLSERLFFASDSAEYKNNYKYELNMLDSILKRCRANNENPLKNPLDEELLSAVREYLGKDTERKLHFVI